MEPASPNTRGEEAGGRCWPRAKRSFAAPPSALPVAGPLGRCADGSWGPPPPRGPPAAQVPPPVARGLPPPPSSAAYGSAPGPTALGAPCASALPLGAPRSGPRPFSSVPGPFPASGPSPARRGPGSAFRFRTAACRASSSSSSSSSSSRPGPAGCGPGPGPRLLARCFVPAGLRPQPGPALPVAARRDGEAVRPGPSGQRRLAARRRVFYFYLFSNSFNF